MLLSRVTGLIREAALAAFLGGGAFTDAWAVAIRGPNLLQNLLGEQALSASFLPVYSRLIAEGRREEAGRLAGAALGLLIALVVVLVSAGVLLAPWIVTLVAPGFRGDAAEIEAGTATVDRFVWTVRAVRVVFPMTGLLVLSAWCLAILNSHRKFFLSYAAPALWNLSIIAGLTLAGTGAVSALFGAPVGPGTTLMAAAVGALVGGLLQFGVQLPAVLLAGGAVRPTTDLSAPGARETLSRFGPALAGRGAFQLSSWIETILAAALAVGAPAILLFSQRLAALPVSLFGSAVAIADLPDLSSAGDDEEARSAIRQRMSESFTRSMFFIVPSAVGALLFGQQLVSLVYRRGAFGENDTFAVGLTLGAYGLGMVATTATRLTQNVFFAHGDTGTPAKAGLVRIVAMVFCALPLMRLLDQIEVGSLRSAAPSLEDPRYLGALGLALGSVMAAWFELGLLKWRQRPATGLATPLPWRRVLLFSTLAAASGAIAIGLRLLLGQLNAPRLMVDLLVPVAFAAGYLLLGRRFAAREAEAWLGALGRSERKG